MPNASARARSAPDELAQRFHQGQLRLDTLVWRDGLAEWQPLRDFTGELALHQAPAETFYTPVEPAAAKPAKLATNETRPSSPNPARARIRRTRHPARH